MSLAVRVIPTMLVRGEHLVKGRQFQSWRIVGHAMQAARIYAARGVDELILLDISATPEGRGPNFALVEKLAECCFTPLTVGGGVRTVEDVCRLLRAGADKVAICTEFPIIEEVAKRFGSQAIVACIDIRDGIIYTRCGTDPMTERAWGAKFLAKAFADSGAGEILITSIDREGTMSGYDLDLIREVSEAVSIPVIAHGGCGTYEHMAHAIRAGAHAVAAGAMFQFTEQTPLGAAQYLAEHGLEARLPA